MNDLNILPDAPETWQAKISRLVRDVFLPYAVPYVIPAFLSEIFFTYSMLHQTMTLI